MKTKPGVLALVLAFCCSGLVMAAPRSGTLRVQEPQERHDQDRDKDKDRDRDRAQNQDESRFYNNPYYQRGWKDGEHHKRHNFKNWKSDEDREAYEAGFAHGDRGEKWQKRHNDRDHDHDHDNDRH